MLKIYNHITQKNQEVNRNKKVKIYVCGPTVYDDLHIGNMRPVIVFNALATLLNYLKYEIDFISNITDIDDKIIKRAMEEGISEAELAEKNILAFQQLLTKFSIQYPKTYFKATELLPEMFAFIQELIDKDLAYTVDGNVYFKVNKAPKYGIISGQKTNQMIQSDKGDLMGNKQSPLDFALWKKTTVGIQYDSPFGKGRPGWHTECSLINYHHFKDTIDIHGGGIDLKFPHHENENVQFEMLTNHPLSHFWMYCGFINLQNQKMSKSTGNLIRAKDLIKTYHPEAFKLLVLAHSYRQPITFSYDLMNQYQKQWEKISFTIKRAKLNCALHNIKSKEVDKQIIDEIIYNLNNDFNTPVAISQVFELIKMINKEGEHKTLFKLINTTLTILNDILGFNLVLPKYNQEDLELYRTWELYKSKKNFTKADEIRQILLEKNIIN